MTIAGNLPQDITVQNAVSQDLIEKQGGKTASVIITLRVMPVGVETDLKILENSVREKIRKFIDDEGIRAEKKPIAFGLNAVEFMFVMDENKNLGELEEIIRALDHVENVETIDVRRAVG